MPKLHILKRPKNILIPEDIKICKKAKGWPKFSWFVVREMAQWL